MPIYSDPVSKYVITQNGRRRYDSRLTERSCIMLIMPLVCLFRYLLLIINDERVIYHTERHHKLTCNIDISYRSRLVYVN